MSDQIVIFGPYLNDAKPYAQRGEVEGFFKALREALPGKEEWIKANYKVFADMIKKQGGKDGERQA